MNQLPAYLLGLAPFALVAVVFTWPIRRQGEAQGERRQVVRAVRRGEQVERADLRAAARALSEVALAPMAPSVERVRVVSAVLCLVVGLFVLYRSITGESGFEIWFLPSLLIFNA